MPPSAAGEQFEHTSIMSTPICCMSPSMSICAHPSTTFRFRSRKSRVPVQRTFLYVAGTIVEVCAQNAEPVEYGAALFRVEAYS